MAQARLIEALNEHLSILAEQLGCELRMSGDTPGMMWVEWGRVEGPALDGEGENIPGYSGRYPDISSRYYVNLHELGHYAHGHTQGRETTSRWYEGKIVEHPNGPRWYFDNGVLKSEAQAWEWALDNACYPPTKECALFMWNTCMGSYYAGSTPGQRVFLGNGDRAYVTDAKWDTPDAYFWSIRKRMLSYTEEKAIV